jgi:hypothetical protein
VPLETDALRDARLKFMNRHIDHGMEHLMNMVHALQRVTRNNPEALLAYRPYYAHHKLTVEPAREHANSRVRAHAAGGGDDPIGAQPKEARAYGVELFFSECIGDKKRARVIGNMDWASPLVRRTDADKVIWRSYGVMKALYQIIDKGGPAALDARTMTVEFITKNSEDYGPKLRELLATIR